jgi:DNA-directed RNA polymerase I, II, and III subunit RPABC2
MSDIEDYFSGDDSNSVESNDSEEINKKKNFKSNLKNYKKPEVSAEEEDGILDKNELEDEVDDEIEDVEDDDIILLDEEDEDEDDDDEDDDDDDDDEEDDYYDEQDGGAPKKTAKKTNDTSTKKPVANKILNNIDYEDEDEDDNDENYLQKFDQEMNQHFIKENHPECIIHNYDEVSILTDIVRDSNNIIVDPFHKTIPFLTKYERARILGQRAKQIESGAKPFVKVPENIIDGYLIAEIELREKKIPFIIRRPLPSGACEYWNLRDLELIHF